MAPLLNDDCQWRDIPHREWRGRFPVFKGEPPRIRVPERVQDRRQASTTAGADGSSITHPRSSRHESLPRRHEGASRTEVLRSGAECLASGTPHELIATQFGAGTWPADAAKTAARWSGPLG
ncbi:hypothetical protein CSIM01_10638 [Colletotrichum simmondsii]|uniref:Uncharacterized protein n=1 Tax=Colletotrichum simmondsii TaxID=703756 RepID=A0A135SJQ1_9PEZI|nr:hypothetical protein CSIM01_10638 [Colletotrichum simmondsii]